MSPWGRRLRMREISGVSVVICAYNAAEHLGDAAESILRQTYSDFELIIVDDGSTDETGRIAKELARRDQRVSVISLPGNAGIAHALIACSLTDEGTSIPVMYLFWLLGLLILFPLCLWYGRLKHRQPANSIVRFF